MQKCLSNRYVPTKFISSNKPISYFLLKKIYLTDWLLRGNIYSYSFKKEMIVLQCHIRIKWPFKLRNQRRNMY